jgi:hypothetical protein
MTGHERQGKRGRPLKFGRPGQAVAITLPEEVVLGLRKLHPDLAWAIVTLFEKVSKSRKASWHPPDDAELVAVGGGRSLIAVSRELFHDLPGINIIPLNDTRAFLALPPGRGMSDLELVVIDRLASVSIAQRERQALQRLRSLLRQWRTDQALRIGTRAIIVLERTNGSHRPSRRARLTEAS